tara:strand:- start:732 stop:2615 length:1884 start_codon:yes stop_codon:yes gene_type:complete
MAVSKIRFYKNVTPPTGRINAKSFKVTVKAVNSLGATVNSLGVVVKSLRDGMVAEMEDARKAAALARDKARENRIEAITSNAQKIVGNIAKASIGFLGHLWKLFKNLIVFSALQWLSDPKNQANLQRTFDRVGNFFKWMFTTFTRLVDWIGKTWDQTFGEKSNWWDRLKGAAKLMGAASAALLGLSFLTSPIATVKAFSSMLSLVGKGIMNMAKFLGGNIVGQLGLGAVAGVASYNDIMSDESIDEEDRNSAAIGGGVGAGVGATGGAMIGNQIAGPIGGAIGGALGGFLGKNVGKFLGPIAKDFFNTLKEIFGKIQAFAKKIFDPVMKAFKDMFVAMGPVIDNITKFIKPHLPVLMNIAEQMGKIVLSPLILLFKGITALLKMVPSTDVTPTGDGDNVKQMSAGGWISGPMSGYPVSLNGTQVDFIGHGVEYVAKRSSGGFVIPFDTPHTRMNPGLTASRMSQASSMGFKVPQFSDGGQIAPTMARTVHLGNIPELSTGGMFKAMKSLVGRVADKVEPVIMSHPVINAVAPIFQAVSPDPKEVGKLLQAAYGKVKTAASKASGANMKDSIQTIVADAMVLPDSKTIIDDGPSPMPIVQEGPRNPATDYLFSRFGRSAEGSAPLSSL